MLCVEYYNRVAENFLELASTQRLHLLFKLMERSRKRLEPLAKELDACLVTTEKDYSRLNNEDKKNIKYLKLELLIDKKEEFINELKKII